jgi:hypothetical protein
LWAALGSPPGAAAVVLLLLCLYAVPPVAVPVFLAAGAPEVAAMCLVAYLSGVAGRVVSAASTGGRVWPDPLAHPVSVGLFGWLIWRSYRMRRLGRLTWRGRPV